MPDFCTVQESTFFGADFRMAQPVETMDGSRQRYLTVNTLHSYVPDAFTMTRYDLGLRHPDFLQCALTSPSAAALEMRVIDPNGVAVAGGNGSTDTGKFYTGNRGLYGGFSNYWHVEISPRESYLRAFPVFFSFDCAMGNGMSINTIPLEGPDQF